MNSGCFHGSFLLTLKMLESHRRFPALLTRAEDLAQHDIEVIECSAQSPVKLEPSMIASVLGFRLASFFKFCSVGGAAHWVNKPNG
jgi:hypothetical protein